MTVDSHCHITNVGISYCALHKHTPGDTLKTVKHRCTVLLRHIRSSTTHWCAPTPASGQPCKVFVLTPVSSLDEAGEQ